MAQQTQSSYQKTSEDSSEARVNLQAVAEKEEVVEQSLTDSTPLYYDENIPLKRRLQEKKLLDRLRIKEGGFLDQKITFGDHYDFISVLGKGAFGHVLRVRRKDELAEEVALKVIAKNELKQADLNAIMNEAEIHSTMQHPNIVCLKGLHETKDVLIIEMELCRFGNLN